MNHELAAYRPGAKRIGLVAGLLGLLLMQGCARAEVTRLDRTPRPATAALDVEILLDEPERPYQRIAIINVDDQSWGLSGDALLRKMAEEAGRIGGHAVIVSLPRQSPSGYVTMPIGDTWYTGAMNVKSMVGVVVVFTSEPPRAGGSETAPAVEPFAMVALGERHVGQMTDELDLVYFDGRAGERVAIDVGSREFDTTLALYRLEQVEALVADTAYSPVPLAENDDIESSTNSRIVIELPATGRYVIVVGGYGEGARGAYALVVSDATGPEWAAHFAPRDLPELDGRWEVVSDDGGAFYYIDRQSIGTRKDGGLDVWAQIIYAAPVSDTTSPTHDRIMILTVMDCARRRIRWMEAYSYLGQRLVESTSEPTEWIVVVPESNGERMFEAACLGVGGAVE